MRTSTYPSDSEEQRWVRNFDVANDKSQNQDA